MGALRFCLLSTFYPPDSFGGDGVFVARLATELRDRGHDVTVVHAREAYRALGGRGVGPGTPPEGVRTVAIDTHTGKAGPLATYLSGRPALQRRALAAVLDEGFDVLHVHNPSLLGGPAVLGMGRADVRLYTAHEQWLVCPTHVLMKYGRRVCEKPQCVRCTIVQGRPPQPWRSTGLLERSLGALDALICPSASSAALHASLAASAGVELVRLPHFVPRPAPAGDDDDDGPGRPFFLYAGRLETIKGVGDLIAALASRTDEDLVISGWGSLEKRLREQAAGQPNVRFVGRVEPDELDRLYRRALAVIAPSVGHESFGLVPVEAFARGTPAVVRDFSALGELATQTAAALPFATAADLNDHLDRLVADPGWRHGLGEQARTDYERRWTPEAHIDAYLALVARLRS